MVVQSSIMSAESSEIMKISSVFLLTGIRSANMASLSIRTLTDRNLITRVPNPKDRRAANVTLSRKGARFVHATKGELIDIFDSCYPALAERETLEFFPA